jgi:putative endonuclease
VARDRVRRGAAARQSGRLAEWLALGLVLLKGYRILGFRYRTKAGEIDILAYRQHVLVAFEVKQRASLALALESVRPEQRRRIRRAASQVAAGHQHMKNWPVRLDLLVFAWGSWPRHIEDAWPEDFEA